MAPGICRLPVNLTADQELACAPCPGTLGSRSSKCPTAAITGSARAVSVRLWASPALPRPTPMRGDTKGQLMVGLLIRAVPVQLGAEQDAYASAGWGVAVRSMTTRLRPWRLA